MLPPITAEDVIDTSEMEDAIEEVIQDFIWKQKQAYGIEYTTEEVKIDPNQFVQDIEQFLKSCGEFENENEACDAWLTLRGYELIQKAIFS